MNNEFEPNNMGHTNDEAKQNLDDLQRILAEDAAAEAKEMRRSKQSAPKQSEQPEPIEATQETASKQTEKPAPKQPIKKELLPEDVAEKSEESAPKQPEKREILSEDAAVLAVEKAAARERAKRRAAEVAAQKRLEAQQRRVESSAPHTEAPRKSTAPASNTVAPKKRKPQSPKAAAAARRRKIRMYRMGIVLVVFLLLIVLIVSGVRAIMGHIGNSSDAKQTEAAGSGIVAEQQEQDDRPASEQESKQYLAIKDDTSLLDYELKYPGLYSDWVSTPNKQSEKKVCYITFDDGPSAATTPQVLDTLKEYDVKATFFVVGKELEENKDLLQRILDEGHTLGIHANVHEYGTVYESVNNYIDDIATVYDKIYDLTGYRAQCFRFIGGSNNGVLTSNGTYDDIVTEMTRRGFEYFDWNAYDHDSEGGNYSAAEMANYAISEVEKSSRDDVILLMHDIKKGAVEALPTIIKTLQKDGIECKALDDTSRPVHFSVNDSTPPEFTEEETEDTSAKSESSDSSSKTSDSSSKKSN